MPAYTCFEIIRTDKTGPLTENEIFLALQSGNYVWKMEILSAHREIAALEVALIEDGQSRIVVGYKLQSETHLRISSYTLEKTTIILGSAWIIPLPGDIVPKVPQSEVRPANRSVKPEQTNIQVTLDKFLANFPLPIKNELTLNNTKNENLIKEHNNRDAIDIYLKNNKLSSMRANSKLIDDLYGKGKFKKVPDQENLSMEERFQLAKALIHEVKPSYWQFWRRAERNRYEALERDVRLYCIIKAFSNKKIDADENKNEIDEITLLELLKYQLNNYKYSKNEREKLQNLYTNLLQQYAIYLNTLEQKEKTTQLKRPLTTYDHLMSKKGLKPTANNSSSNQATSAPKEKLHYSHLLEFAQKIDHAKTSTKKQVQHVIEARQWVRKQLTK